MTHWPTFVKWVCSGSRHIAAKALYKTCRQFVFVLILTIFHCKRGVLSSVKSVLPPSREMEVVKRTLWPLLTSHRSSGASVNPVTFCGVQGASPEQKSKI